MTTLKLTRSESVAIRSSTPQALEVEATYGPHGNPPPKHFHPDQDEHFEVLEGVLRVRVNGEERDLRRGDTIDIPRRALHQMWNPHGEPASVVWRTTPGGRTEQWFRALDAVQRQGLGGALKLPALLFEYRDVIRLAPLRRR